MRCITTCTLFFVTTFVLPFNILAAQTIESDKDKIVSEATGGKFSATEGSYFEEDCGESLNYSAEIVDLNGDGQPEVFSSIDGTCMGGVAGTYMDLYIKNKSGQWKAQFGFPGIPEVLKTKNKGYPDIEIGGPGFCFPVWRWNGQQYSIHKRCDK